MQAGLTDILIITGRNKRAVEDHFDRNFELEHYLETTGKHAHAEGSAVRVRPRRHPLRAPARSARPRARGVGRAPSRRQRAVRGAARRRPHGRRRERCSVRCSARTSSSGSSVVAMQEVSPEEISSYGCVEPDGDGGDGVVTIRRIVEKPAREVAPSNLAVIGRYVFTPGDLRRARSHRARRRRRAPAHRRDRAAARRADGARVALRGRPLRRRPQARLPPRQHRARARPRRSRARRSPSGSRELMRRRGIA